MKSKELKNKIAIVTGAAQGLGEALALSLAENGCHVTVADINIEQAQKTALKIQKKYGRKSLAVRVDVTVEDDVRKMVAQTNNKFKRIDILVSNAGILYADEISGFPADMWKKVIEVNLFGYFLCAKHASRIMKKHGKIYMLPLINWIF